MVQQGKRMPEGVRRQIIRLAAEGLSCREVAGRVDVCAQTVSRVVKPFGGVHRKHHWERSEARLTLDDRVDVQLGLGRGESFRQIAASIGRAPSTVCREVAANGGRSAYQALRADRRAQEAARRPKTPKLAANPPLQERVAAELSKLWSPQQIAQRLRAEFGDDPTMTVSHETIYKSLYVQGRGELRRELTRCLRSGRAARKPQGRLERRGSLPDMVMISERPAEIEDRAVPGHWEGDLILGKNGRSAIGTLVERSTRFVMLLHLPDGRSADQVRQAMTRTIATLPAAVCRSITWDQGKEMSGHAKFTLDTGIQIYFCDPHSPWQRGSNENTNGLLRQYFPKGTDLSVHDVEALQAAADSLNGRPRKTLNWMTPSEKLAELLQ